MIINRTNNRIGFYDFQETVNKYGEINNDRVHLFSLWSDIDKSTLKEYRNKSFEDLGTEKIVFIVDHRASLKVKREMWIKFRDDFYNIINIERDYSTQNITKITATKVDK